MKGIASDPVQALAILAPGQSAQAEREWLQNTLAWLKSVPPEKRTERLRGLAEGIGGNPDARERFRQIWEKAFAPRVFAEAGLPEATSLARELMARVKRRVLPQPEDELDLYAALQGSDLNEEDAEWVAGLSEEDAAPWRELVGGSAADFAVAIRLLALRAAAIGLSRGIMKLMPHQYETESPFFDLVDAAGRFERSPDEPGASDRFEEVVLECPPAFPTRAWRNGASPPIWCFGWIWCWRNWRGSKCCCACCPAGKTAARSGRCWCAPSPRSAGFTACSATA
jgi:site-specific recombinase